MTKALDATVRPIQPRDVAAVVQLCSEHTAFEQAAFCGDGKIEDLSRALFATEPELWGFVVEINDVVVGYATCTRALPPGRRLATCTWTVSTWHGLIVASAWEAI